MYTAEQKDSFFTKSDNLKYRMTAGVISMMGLALLITAGVVSPNPSGYGTHEQLHLPPCGFLERTGYPCPTCGMTTAFSLVVRGKLFQAFKAQPAGALAAIFCVFLVSAAGYAALTGKRYQCWHIRRNGYTIFLIALAIVILSWLWQCAAVWFKTH